MVHNQTQYLNTILTDDIRIPEDESHVIVPENEDWTGLPIKL